METNFQPKQVFTARLFEYLSNNQNTKFGYIKDISLSFENTLCRISWTHILGPVISQAKIFGRILLNKKVTIVLQREE
jgi:hypothetical protein